MSQISTKPASGMRDFLPREAALRKRVFALIEEVYQSYGFQPLETPTMENLSTLMGKYGEEGDQLLFKVMKRGNKLQKALKKDAPTEVDLADMGLRYDLTVPLARIVAQYQNELPRYFKRFQIAPVWRADRPQRGRFREFYQCDVDVIGSTSMTVEVEVASAICEVLERLEFKNFRIHLNHRLLLNAMMEAAGVPADLQNDALVAIDKLDKIGLDGVKKELSERGISDASTATLLPLLGLADEVEGNQALLAALAERVGELESGNKALSELGDLLRFAATTPAAPYLKIDPYLARGLSYYTGPIFEIRSDDFSGSLGGGGRYDGLIGMFTRQSLPACGFSLGLERVLMLLAERDALAEPAPDVDVLVTLWRDDFTPKSLALAGELRAAGLRVDLYPDADKYGKQFKYADERNVPFVAILAENELEQGVVSIKDMKRGDQAEVPRHEVADWIKARQA
ncbi:histidine--tRNA ligase [Bradymonadaceae bacterium TMQ3]|uniref:Histidine--tRNA ligase n=1 Tax=Lujinxingia sediminis TaxID=2480984 RepID=A0ABY0CRH6_9DELT|nr:histidine--tRNA ligase [Lujinxingia sediminis]RDV37879.1 histidine--tRNA ligase [Bradymonadaceae bacterium TMQ3]RVU42788.1 histidine--tRNA ligase [Lujinxingia sediminis]TXC75339.1 histidine--tRNA ligase [Bradymonadales bacterium TMQ1]